MRKPAFYLDAKNKRADQLHICIDKGAFKFQLFIESLALLFVYVWLPCNQEGVGDAHGGVFICFKKDLIGTAHESRYQNLGQTSCELVWARLQICRL